MRIVVVSANFAPRIGGIERFSQTLATGLARKGHDVEVVCCREGGAPLREHLDGFAIERIRCSYALHRHLNVAYPLPAPADAYRALRRALRGADVVHVQDVLYATSLPALLLARRRRIARVLTQHAGFVPQANPALDAVENGALALLGRCARLADVVAALNDSTAAWAARRWKLDDVRVVPTGIAPPPSPDEHPDTIRAEFGLPPGRFLALFIGRDVPTKGLDIFVGAADPGHHLVAVTETARYETSSDVTVLPFMAPGRLNRLLHCVDAFVLPSRSEGLPISLQEALAAGVPVVTTRLPGYRGFLGDDDVLFVDRDPGNVRAALTRLAGDDALRSRLAARSKDVARAHFGADRMIDAYESLYLELLDRPSR